VIDLSGKVALVTGGSRGIGAATAILLAKSGAGVAITYRTRKADAEVVVEACSGKREASGGTGNGERGKVPPYRPTALPPIAIQADVSRREDNERAIAETVQHFGGLDIFVANAGIWPPEEIPVAEMSDEHWTTTLATNLNSVFLGCRAAMNAMVSGNGERGTGKGSAVPPFRRSAGGEGKRETGNGKGTALPPYRPTAGGGGRIVVVSSTAGQRGEGYHADYAASKGAVQAFVKSLCVEAAPYDITVNAVAPGWVDTEMCEVPFGREAGSGKREIEVGIPLGRVASPKDIAGPIVFLCSDLARHITGEC
jgi:3-oxoacyl-[acyl-carrier protein] reductase